MRVSKSTDITSYIEIAKEQLFASVDTSEFNILVGRKFISSADTLYDVIIYTSKTINEENRQGVSLPLDNRSTIENAANPIGVTTMIGHLFLVVQFRLNEEEVYRLT